MTQEQLVKNYIEAIENNLTMESGLILITNILENISNYIFTEGNIKESQIINEFIEKLKGWL